MATKPKHVVCVHCHLGQEQELKQTFLGFFTFRCAECKKENTYPLSDGYIVIYGIALVLFVVGLASGRMVAVILAVGGGIALGYDFTIRRAAKEAQANERKAGETPVSAKLGDS